MKVGFIGAGKVGFSLGRFFAESGIQVTGYFSRHREVFYDVKEQGAYGYTIHPLFPISDKLNSYREIADAFFVWKEDSAFCEKIFV